MKETTEIEGAKTVIVIVMRIVDLVTTIVDVGTMRKMMALLKFMNDVSELPTRTICLVTVTNLVSNRDSVCA